MTQTATPQRYGLISQLFHWSVVLMMIAMLVTDSLRSAAPKDSEVRAEWLHLHISLGLLLFLIVIVRILWSRLSPQPAPVPGSPWIMLAAKGAHLLLNLATLLVPVFGYLRVVSKGRTVEFFGVQVPSLIGESPQINDLMHILHGEPMEIFFYVVIGLHVVAALWHQYRLRDGTLERMLPWGRTAG